MELVGRYIAALISETSTAHSPLGIRSGHWLVGKVEVETPGVGVWVAIEAAYLPDRKRKLTLVPEGLTTLLRWDWIAAAMLASTKERVVESIGSQLMDRAAERII
jgi:hypothetical protein